MTEFIDYMTTNTFLTTEEIDRVVRASILRRVPHRQHLLREGTVWKWHVFVMKGCLRTYYIDPGDKHQTIAFAISGCWTGDRESMATGKPSQFNIHALQDSEVALIADTEFHALRKSIAGFNALANNIVLHAFRRSQKRLFSSVSHTVDQKLAAFRADYPTIANSVPKHMLASYFGISFEYFSRSQTGKYNRKG
jgi:CRP-like cAMP-binding protein